MDGIKLLLITGEYPPMEGGVADFTAIVAERLANRGAAVHVLTSEQAGTQRQALGPVTVHARMSDWGFRSLFRAVRELVTELAPDVVNIQYQTAAYGMHPAVNLFPRFFGEVPVVTTFHDLKVPYLLPKATALRRWVNLDLARNCRAVIATNAQDRAELEQVEGVKRIEMIPIGSNISYHLPPSFDRGVWRGQWGVSHRTTLLSFFGFLNDSKGAIELIEAVKQLTGEGLPVDLVMIGGAVSSSNASNQTYYDRVKNTIIELNLEDHVFWTGYVANEEVSAAFTSSDVCVLPFADGASFRRGSLMAALTHGVPIISTYPEVSVPELVHGENIYLVPPNDAAAIAQAVREMARDDALRARLAQGARELSRHFDWDTIADRTLALFHEVIGLSAGGESQRS
jgi:glycosyltransferase involved in cell wall biosynthesis